MHRSKLYAFTVLALLVMGAIVSVQANNGVIAPPPPPDPNGVRAPGGGYDAPPTPLSPPCGSKGNNPQPELVVSSMATGTYNFRVYRGDTRELVAETYTNERNWVVTTVTPGLPPGTYSWSCRANPTVISSTRSWSGFFEPYWTFEIDEFSPPMDPILPPSPVSPPSGSKGGNRNPELIVLGLAGAEMYHFRVYRNMSTVLVSEAYTTDPNWVVSAPLQNPVRGLTVGVYSWTCRVNMQGGWSEVFLPHWTFEVQKLEPPAGRPPVIPPPPVSPPSGTKGGNPNPELVVLGVAGAELYHFRVYRDMTNVLVTEAYTTDPHWVATTLPNEISRVLPVGAYSWTCRATVLGYWSEFFLPHWTFEVRKYEPPADGAVGNERPWDPTLQPRTRPNPFGSAGTRIQMALPSSSINATAAVYSTEGRLVRRLHLSRGPNGLCEFPWDGKDETGSSVGAGTYLCQITAGDMHKVVELVKSR
jgi:hypothetical protein